MINFAEVDQLVDAFVAREPVPGLAYGVIVGGELVHTRGIGTGTLGAGTPPTADTVFRIASMTKSFTAATVLLLRDEGHLRLDDPVADHVPELQGQRASHPGAPTITLRHLLSMSAGFPGDDPWGDRQQDLDSRWVHAVPRRWAVVRVDAGDGVRVLEPGLCDPRPRHRERDGPGVSRRRPVTVARADGYGVHGLRAAEFPAGRLATGYVRRDDAYVEEPFAEYGAFAPMGGAFSTVRDLALWVDGFARAFQPRGATDDHPLSRASRLEMQQVHRPISPEITWSSIAELPRAVVTGYGFGTFVRSDRSSARSWRTAAAIRGSGRTCGGIRRPAWASSCWATGPTTLRARSASRC